MKAKATKPAKCREFTASEITTYALNVLSYKGYEVWRSNNLAVKGRKFIGKRGVADITGYCKTTGKRVECEVKKIGDTLSPAQHEFLSDAALSGCMVYVAKQEGGEIIVQEYFAVAA